MDELTQNNTAKIREALIERGLEYAITKAINLFLTDNMIISIIQEVDPGIQEDYIQNVLDGLKSPILIS